VLVFGLVQDRGWEPDEDPEPAAPRRLPHVPWRPFAWFAVWCWLVLLGGTIGGFAGFLVVVGASAAGYWRFDRWCARQHWTGLRDHRS
jgi:hypothetical protein